MQLNMLQDRCCVNEKGKREGIVIGWLRWRWFPVRKFDILLSTKRRIF